MCTHFDTDFLEDARLEVHLLEDGPHDAAFLPVFLAQFCQTGLALYPYRQ